MNFDEYQNKAWGYAMPTAKTTQYLLPGLAGEVGELSSLFAKSQRDGNALDHASVTKELGDVLWFVSTIAFYYGISLADLAEKNIEKLESRKLRGVIGGSGDNR
jgi:NTP pyrophosphatase (non-canonical NTP hydrolase)